MSFSTTIKWHDQSPLDRRGQVRFDASTQVHDASVGIRYIGRHLTMVFGVDVDID